MCSVPSLARSVRWWFDTKAFFTGENAGAAAARRPVCTFQVAAIIPSSFRPHFSAICPTNRTVPSKHDPPDARETHLATFIDRAGTAFAQPWPGAGKHGRSADSPTAACRASALVLPLDAYGDRRGCSVATRKRIREGRNVCNATFCYVTEGKMSRIKKKLARPGKLKLYT